MVSFFFFKIIIQAYCVFWMQRNRIQIILKNSHFKTVMYGAQVSEQLTVAV